MQPRIMKVKCFHVRLFRLEKNNLAEFHKFIIINLETENCLKTEYYQVLLDWCFFLFFNGYRRILPKVTVLFSITSPFWVVVLYIFQYLSL